MCTQLNDENRKLLAALYEAELGQIFGGQSAKVVCHRVNGDQTLCSKVVFYCDYPKTRSELARVSGETPRCSVTECAVVTALPTFVDPETVN